MLKRCRDPNQTSFKNYGGRGIAVCTRWHDFKNFLEDMGERPSLDYSIDRIDNNGNYELSNCRWATRKEQRRNSRASKYLTFNGKTQSLAAWADELGLSYTRTRARLRLGWSVDRAFTAPNLRPT